MAAHILNFMYTKEHSMIPQMALYMLTLLSMMIFESSSERVHFCHDLKISSGSVSFQSILFKQVSLNKNFPITMAGADIEETKKTLLSAGIVRLFDNGSSLSRTPH